MLIQLRVVDGIVATEKHDTYQISKAVPYDPPIPRRSLGVTRHYVGGDSQLLGTHLGVKVFLCHIFFVEEERKQHIFAVCPHAG